MRKDRIYQIVKSHDEADKSFQFCRTLDDGSLLYKYIGSEPIKMKPGYITNITDELVRCDKYVLPIKDQTDKGGILKISLLPLNILTSARKTIKALIMNKNKKQWQKTLHLKRSQKSQKKSRTRLQLIMFSMKQIWTRLTRSNTSLSRDQEGRSCDPRRSQRISNLVAVSILWATLLGLSTTIFPHPYKDNAFFLINLSYVSFVSGCIGLYAFNKRFKWNWVNKFLKAVTFMNALYFGLGAVGEVINLLWNPYFVINSIFGNSTGIMFAFLFHVGIVLAFVVERNKAKT